MCVQKLFKKRLFRLFLSSKSLYVYIYYIVAASFIGSGQQNDGSSSSKKKRRYIFSIFECYYYHNMILLCIYLILIVNSIFSLTCIICIWQFITISFSHCSGFRSCKSCEYILPKVPSSSISFFSTLKLYSIFCSRSAVNEVVGTRPIKYVK